MPRFSLCWNVFTTFNFAARKYLFWFHKYLLNWTELVQLIMNWFFPLFQHASSTPSSYLSISKYFALLFALKWLSCIIHSCISQRIRLLSECVFSWERAVSRKVLNEPSDLRKIFFISIRIIIKSCVKYKSKSELV